jgi:SsrA-binding protein
MANKKKLVKKPSAVVNKRATFDYTINSGDELITGMSLTGPETRAARDGHIQLKGAFVTIRDNELWLNNASFSLKINEKNKAGARTIDTTPRKLLAKRKQIDELYARKQTGMTIVPLRLLTKGRFIKLVIALGKGKKNYDKRETLKRRDSERDASRAIKTKGLY